MSKVGDLNNLVTKNVTKYPVLGTLKILKITKKNISNFFKKLEMFFFVILRIFKVPRTGYFVTSFVTRLSKSPTVLKPALYTVVAYIVAVGLNLERLYDTMIRHRH